MIPLYNEITSKIETYKFDEDGEPLFTLNQMRQAIYNYEVLNKNNESFL